MAPCVYDILVLQSRYDVFIKLAQVVSPVVWGSLFTAFGNAPPESALGR